MKSIPKSLIAATLCASLGLSLAAPGPADDASKAADYFRNAPLLAHPEKASILAATLAGQRVVAAGDYGVILYSDDGQSFRQAKVPTRALLTSLFFLDARHGWAAGHDGTILSTEDAGESWTVRREARGQDQVLMSIWFENAEHGLAVGQFGLALETEDGGASWQERSLLDGEAGEKHFQQLVPVGSGVLLVAAEAGAILRSADAGRHWQLVQTDNKGSFWTGQALPDGSVLMGGMRGHLYRSEDRGQHWQEIASGTQQSLTGFFTARDGTLGVVGLAGTTLLSKDGGKQFTAATRPDRLSLTAALALPDGKRLGFSASGQLVRD